MKWDAAGWVCATTDQVLKKVDISQSRSIVEDCDGVIHPSDIIGYALASGGTVCRTIDVGTLIENPVENVFAVNEIAILWSTMVKHAFKSLTPRPDVPFL